MAAVGQLAVLRDIVGPRDIRRVAAAAVEQYHLPGRAAAGKHEPRFGQRQIEIRTLDRQRRFGRRPERIVAVEHEREQAVAGPRWRAGRDVGFAGRREIAMEALAQEMLIRMDRAVIVKIAYAATGDPAQQPWIGRRNLQQVAGGEGGNCGEAINHRAPPGHI